MESQTNIFNKKFIIIVILFIIGATALLLIYNYSNQNAPLATPLPPEQPKVEREYLPATTLPSELPTNLPFEEGAPLARNEIVKVDGGVETQYVRTYYSKKSVKQNFDIYKKYLTDNGWTIILEQSDKNYATLLAQKDGSKGVFNVGISQNSLTNDITVEVNVIVR